MTKKVYEIDPYMKEHVAQLNKTVEINEELWVVLDQTIFYPEGGGQPHDIGTIDGVQVLDVQSFQDGIYHKVETKLLKNRVKLSIDFSRRFDHMQQHTGQHLLSAVWQELFGFKTNSFHLGKDVCTIDLDTSELTMKQITAVENKVAEYIFENRTVESYILPIDEVDDQLLTKIKDKPSFIRFIEIDGIDQSTCCGTHVSMLGEIGLLKIVGWEKYKKNVRLTFLCGARAFSYFQNISTEINEVSKKLNASPTLIGERFLTFYQSYHQLKKDYQYLYEKAIHHEAKELLEQEETNVIEMIWDDRPLQELKDLAKIMIQSENKVVILSSVKQNNWIFASTSSQIFNVNHCIQTLKDNYGGKGGGNSVFGQWTGELEYEDWLKIKALFV